MEHRRNILALGAFGAVSRHLCDTAAAADPGVTQSAIGHPLRLLNEVVGDRLLQKRGRAVVLIEAGRRLA